MSVRPRPPIWLWFNLLSLDAPIIALIWQDFLSRCFPTTLLAIGRGVLGFTVWAIYLGDRLLDVRHPALPGESLRHQFYRSHRTFAGTLFAAVLCIDIFLVSRLPRPAVVGNGLLVTAAVALYMGVFPLTGWAVTIWKKPLAAFLFTAGTFLIAWTNTSQPLHQLVWAAAAFCALCLGNLLMIGRWSREPGYNLSGGWIWIVLLAACLALSYLALTHGSRWFTAIIFSAAGLCAVATWGRRISGEVRCVLADAVLLTPLLFR